MPLCRISLETGELDRFVGGGSSYPRFRRLPHLLQLDCLRSPEVLWEVDRVSSLARFRLLGLTCYLFRLLQRCRSFENLSADHVFLAV